MMQQFIDLRRPAQLNGWFAAETGGETLPEVVAQLHAAGLADARSDLPGHPFPKRMGAYQEQAPATAPVPSAGKPPAP